MVGMWCPKPGINQSPFNLFMFQIACLVCSTFPAFNCQLFLYDVFQAQGANGAKLRYTGMTDVLRKTVQADGFKGLYRVSFISLHLFITAVSALFEENLLIWDSQAAYMLEGSQQWYGFLVGTWGYCSIACACMCGIAQCWQTCERVCTLCTLDGQSVQPHQLCCYWPQGWWYHPANTTAVHKMAWSIHHLEWLCREYCQIWSS